MHRTGPGSPGGWGAPPSRNRRSGAEGGAGGEGAAGRVPAVDSYVVVVEPAEERQFLQVIGGAAADLRRWERELRAGQRVTDLQVALTIGLLADVAPRRDRVVAERVVGPLADLVRQYGLVGDAAELTVGDVVAVTVGLAVAAAVERRVVPEDAATARGEHDVLEQEERERGGVDPEAREFGDQRALHEGVPRAHRELLQLVARALVDLRAAVERDGHHRRLAASQADVVARADPEPVHLGPELFAHRGADVLVVADKGRARMPPPILEQRPGEHARHRADGFPAARVRGGRVVDVMAAAVGHDHRYDLRRDARGAGAPRERVLADDGEPVGFPVVAGHDRAGKDRD